MKKISSLEIKELALIIIIKSIIAYGNMSRFKFRNLDICFYYKNYDIKIYDKISKINIKTFKINPNKTCDIEYTSRFALILYKYLDFKSKKLKDL